LLSRSFGGLVSHEIRHGPTGIALRVHFQQGGSLARTSPDRPVATISIQRVPLLATSSGGTISSHRMTSPLSGDGPTPWVRVACQRPLLSRSHSAGNGRTTLP
jgi:hypothetical protein